MSDTSTEAIARQWFDLLTSGRGGEAIALLDDDIEWINYSIVKGYNDDMPWIGTYRGVKQVVKTFEIFLGLVEVRLEELKHLVVQGDDAMGVIHEISLVKKTGIEFEIEFIQWLTIKNGKIVRWKSYTDPSQIIRALRG